MSTSPPQGWWFAADGRWYPPEAHPAAQLPPPGWWQGNDGRWYPPEAHPAYRPPAPVYPTAPPYGPAPPYPVVFQYPAHYPQQYGTPWAPSYPWPFPPAYPQPRQRPGGLIGALMAVVVVLVLIGLVLVAVGNAPSSTAASFPTTPGFFSPAVTSCTTAAPTGTTTVPMQVLQENSAVVAFVPVCLNGHGPYPFVLDTGSAETLVVTSLAQAAGLTSNGPPVTANGAGCSSNVSQLQVGQWSIGSVPLTAQGVVSTNLFGGSSSGGIGGLIGSDVLSRFGAVKLNFAQKILTLPGPEGPPLAGPLLTKGPTSVPTPPDLVSGTPTHIVPMRVLNQDHTVAALVPVSFAGGPTKYFVLDTGSSRTTVDSGLVASAGLQPTGQKEQIGAVGCTETTSLVKTGSWAIGDVPLPSDTAYSTPLNDIQVQGLFGADELSSFGTVVIDYAGARLLLGIP